MAFQGKLTEQDQQQLEEINQYLISARDRFLGYPITKNIDFSQLYHFLNFPLNNLGDPFDKCTWQVHTHKLEKQVIDFFAHLFRAPIDDYWGYVTNGSSESNLYALYLARELYPNAQVYCSDSSHYSINKNSHLLNIPTCTVSSQQNGEMDYAHLEALLTKYRHKPAIIVATFGTTMTEAKDDILIIKQIVNRLNIEKHYLHCDAAFSGGYGAFIKPHLSFDFADGVDSICVSGHKFIGSPSPCGVIITRKSYRNKIAKNVAYIGSLDSTITGSRNGHSPLFLWYAIKQLGTEGLAARYHQALKVAKYCEACLCELGINAWRNPEALTVMMPKTTANIRLKYQLATENTLTHIICMPDITYENIDQFILDLQKQPPKQLEE